MASIIVDTEWLPRFVIPLESKDSRGSRLMQILKPAITLDAGPVTGTFAPEGRPETNRWPLVATGLVLVVGSIAVLSVLGIVYLAKR